jgi:uncharacterized NAD(P)/FAD-binding protein YdhS
MGIQIEVRTQATVADVLIIGDKIRLTVRDARSMESNGMFDYVILATGHQWPPDPEVRPGYFTSPWPASALGRIHNCAVAIRGTSLSAIDASVAVANNHGEFAPSGGDELRYVAKAATEKFSITMLSRKGILPEADFFHPIPYEPLVYCNAETMQMLIADSLSEGLLDAAFDLFRREVMQTDPEYAEAMGLQTQTLEEFCGAYFAARAQADPFDWAQRNLMEAVSNMERHFTVPWRYAILRMHEVFGVLAHHLSDVEFERFSETLKPVFVDNYATVPHESVRRLLALHAAGRLRVARLDEGHRLDLRSAGPGATLLVGTNSVHFPVLIEATGQQVLGAKDFPFPSLRRQGVIQDMTSDEATEAKRGIAIDGDFHPISVFESANHLFCLSLPFLLGKHPFAQGITSSAEMAEVVADAIHKSEAAVDRENLTAQPSTAV